MAVLQYDFAVVGANTVNRAFASIEKRAALHNSRMKRMMGGPTSMGGSRGGRAQIDGAARAAKAIEAKATRDRIAGEKAIQREQARTAKEKERATRRYGQIQAKQHRADLAHIRRQRREADRAAMSAMRERQRVTGRTVGRIGRSAVGATRAIGGTALGALSIGGGLAAGAAVSSVMQQEAAASALANQAYGTRGGGGRDRASIRRGVLAQSQRLGISSGLGAEGVIGGLRQMAAISGRLDIGQSLAPMMVDLASATDADVGDVGRTTGQIVQAMSSRGLATPEILKQTQEILMSMAGQAKVGSIEFADLATQMGKVMSATAGYEGQIGDLAATMGAVSQLAIAGGASSPEEAMTAILRLGDAFKKDSGKFEKQGIDVFTDESRTSVRNPLQILKEVLGKTKGDISKISGLFGIRAQKAVLPFQEAFRGAGGDPAQVVDKLLMSVKGAKMSQAELRESSKFRASQRDRGLSSSFEQFKIEVGSELITLLDELVPIMREVVPAAATAARIFVKIAESLINSPLTTIGTMIATKVAADLAMARIGDAAKGAIVGSMGGKVATAGGAAKGMSLSGATLNGLSIGAATGMVIYASGVTMFEKGERSVERGGALLNVARDAATRGDEQGVRAALSDLREIKDESGEKGFFENMLVTALGDSKVGRKRAAELAGTGAQRQSLENFEDEMLQLAGAAKKAKAELDAVKAPEVAQGFGFGTGTNRGNTPSPTNSD